MSADHDLELFIRDNVRSVWALELLLILRSDPARCWAVEELVRELRANTMLVQTNLEIFERSGLSVRDDADCHRYTPASPVLDELCGRLQAAYRQRPVAVINLIAKPATEALQSLADAFKFRGEPK